MGTHWGLDTRGDARQFSALIGYVAEKASQLSREKKKAKVSRKPYQHQNDSIKY